MVESLDTANAIAFKRFLFHFRQGFVVLDELRGKVMVGLRHHAVRQGSNHDLALRTLDDARLAFLRAADGEKDAGAQPGVAQSIHSVIERVAFFQCVPQQEGGAEIKSRQIGGRRPVDRDGISLRQHARQHTDVPAGADDHEFP